MFVDAESVSIPWYERSAPQETVDMTDVFTLVSTRKEQTEFCAEDSSSSPMISNHSSIHKKLRSN